jgi:hypothetical protein
MKNSDNNLWYSGGEIVKGNIKNTPTGSTKNEGLLHWNITRSAQSFYQREVSIRFKS